MVLRHLAKNESFCHKVCVSSCNCISSQPFGAKSFKEYILYGDMYMGTCPTGGNWYKSPTHKTHVSPIAIMVPLILHIV